jgi:hypothetical protein
MYEMHEKKLKSILGFEKWTKKMSKIKKPKYFSAKSHAKHALTP